MQILRRFAGSIQRYSEEQLSDPDLYRPDHCPQCETRRPVRAHGFYTRTMVDVALTAPVSLFWHLSARLARHLPRSRNKPQNIMELFGIWGPNNLPSN